MKYEDWLDAARKEINTFTVGKIFVVRDLFVGADWDKQEKGDRIGFGKFFKRKVADGDIENVEYIGKAKNNSAQYRKINT